VLRGFHDPMRYGSVVERVRLVHDCAQTASKDRGAAVRGSARLPMDEPRSERRFADRNRQIRRALRRPPRWRLPAASSLSPKARLISSAPFPDPRLQPIHDTGLPRDQTVL
jgi:hypothetical protein